MSKQTNEPSLQQQMARLDELAAWFEQEDFDIEEALKKFDEATELAVTVKARLGELENNITVLKQRFDNQS